MVNEQVFPELADWVLDRLRGIDGLSEEQVHDGQVQIPGSAPGEPVVVRYELPYVTFTGNVGDVSNKRLAGRSGRHSDFWSLMFVGLTREQVVWLGQRCRNALHEVRPDIAGYKFWPINLDESQRVYRDDDAINVDGLPLFYGVDNYAVAHVIKRVA